MLEFFIEKSYKYAQEYPYLPYMISLSFPIFFVFIGCIFLLKPHWMLEVTRFLEKSVGADWIPSEKTYFIYKNIGIILITFGCGLFGYIWSAR